MTEKELFDLVILIGEGIVENGGEISRATETMEIVAAHYGIRDFKAFAIANGIFASALSADGTNYSCKITCVSLSPIRLSRVEALNGLSRSVADDRCTPEEAREQAVRICGMDSAGKWKSILAAGVGSACFCYLFAGGAADCAAAFFSGSAAYAFIKLVAPRFVPSNLSMQIIGAMIAAFMSCLLLGLGLGNSLNRVIIGSIFPMTPGVSLTNSIRNFLENDYLTGLIRLVDALVTAGCLACGVGLAMQLWNLIIQGAIL